MRFGLAVLGSVLSVTLMGGCDLFKPKATEKVKSAEPVTKPAPVIETKMPPANTDCEFLGFSKVASKLRWKMANGQEIILCEHFDVNKVSDTEYKGWFNLYKISLDSPVPLLDDVKGTVPSEGYYIDVLKESDSKIIIKRMLYVEADLGEDDVVLTTNELDCSSADCQLNATKCGSDTVAYKKESINIVQKVVDRKLKVEDISNYDVVIGDLVRAAVAGNKSAQRLMLDTSRERLRVDGAVGESYSAGLYQLKTLKSLGCLKQ